MLRRTVCVSAVALLIALGLSVSARADVISYTETFQNTFASTSTTFTGSANPNPTWTLGNGTAQVTSAGTLILNGSYGTSATVSASGLTGGSQTVFDVSSLPLTVTATLSAFTTDTVNTADGGWLSVGLVVGGMKIETWPDFSNGTLERVFDYTGKTLVDDWASGYSALSNTPFTVSAKLSTKNSSNYTLDYSFGGVSHSVIVAKTAVGDFSSVGIYLEHISTDTAYVTNFSVSQIPEPNTLVLLVSGLIGLLAYAWQKQK